MRNAGCVTLFWLVGGEVAGYVPGILCWAWSYHLTPGWDAVVSAEELKHASVQFSSVAQSCPTLRDPMDCPMPGFPVHHQLLELTQTHVIELVMPFNQFFLCHPLLLWSSIFLRIRVFSNESVLHIRWPKYREASGSRDGVYGEIGSQTLLLLCCGLFLIFCIWRRFSASFQDLFQRKLSCIYISFPWGLSWSLSHVQCHELQSKVYQALYLSDLVP